MKRVIVVFVMSVALLASSVVPARAVTVRRWTVSIGDVTATFDMGQVVSINGHLSSKFGTCRWAVIVTATYGDATTFGTSGPSGSINDGDFQIDGTGPPGEYTLTTPKTVFDSDHHKRNICKAAKKTVTLTE